MNVPGGQPSDRLTGGFFVLHPHPAHEETIGTGFPERFTRLASRRHLPRSNSPLTVSSAVSYARRPGPDSRRLRAGTQRQNHRGD